MCESAMLPAHPFMLRTLQAQASLHQFRSVYHELGGLARSLG